MWESAAEAFDSLVNYADRQLRFPALEVMNLNMLHPTFRTLWQTAPTRLSSGTGVKKATASAHEIHIFPSKLLNQTRNVYNK